MTYTIINARYANEDNTAIVITTVEAGDVAISEKDTPELWSQVISLEIKPYGEIP
jgi:hypothetical protein